MLLKGKGAIVTGGAAGIGFAIARKFAEHGATVVLADLDEARGEESAEKLRQAGGQAHYVRTDISDMASLDAMVDFAVQRLGNIDILVNNAGVTRRIELLDMTPEQWDWIQNINTRGSFFCLQRVAKHMKAIGRW